MRNLLALVKIEYIFTKRNISIFILGLGLPVGLFFLISSMFSATLDERIVKEATKQFLMSMTIYSSLSFSLFTFPGMFQEDRNNNWFLTINNLPIKMWQYYLTKIVNILSIFFISIITVFLVGIIFKDVELTIKQWLMSGFLILFGNACMLSIGLLIGFIKSQQKFLVVSNVFYIILGMIGGLWWPINQFPATLQKIGKMMPTHHIRELVINYITKDTITYNSMFIIIGYAVVFTTLALVIKRKIEVK